MSTRGWEGVTASQLTPTGQAKVAKPSKWRNIKFNIDGITFDSKHEAQCWAELKLRERAGEIRGLERQVSCPLYAPMLMEGSIGLNVQISEYVADFRFDELDERVFKDPDPRAWTRITADAKGKPTREFALKAKWLWLQSGIEIRLM